MPIVCYRPVNITYQANRISCASCWSFLYFVALIVLPYVAVYALGGMWTKESLVREQPKVRFRYESIVSAYGKSATHEIAGFRWTTSGDANDALGGELRPCELRAWEEDDELDGLADRLVFAVSVPLDPSAGERVHSISALFGVEVLFQTDFQLRLNASLHFEASNGVPGKAVHQSGDLVLRSRKPQRSLDLPERDACPEKTWMLQTPTQPDGSAADAVSVLQRYAGCNDTAVVEPRGGAAWTPGIAPSFDATFTLHVPALLVTRRPGILEALKLAFVQYVAFFLPIWGILSCMHTALFRYGVVTARMRHPIKQHQF